MEIKICIDEQCEIRKEVFANEQSKKGGARSFPRVSSCFC